MGRGKESWLCLPASVRDWGLKLIIIAINVVLN